MNPVNPSDEKDLISFYREWKSNYPDKVKKGQPTKFGLKPPSELSLGILFQYATQGDIPGDFLMAVLQNDLYEVFGKAPLDEVENIHGTVQYVVTYLPYESWGNPEKVGKWLNKLKKSKMYVPTTHY